MKEGGRCRLVSPAVTACLVVTSRESYEERRTAHQEQGQADVSDVISARYDMKLPTVITTEMTFRDVMKAYGKNTAYKLVEDNGGSGGMFAECGDSSLRQEDMLELEDED